MSERGGINGYVRAVGRLTDFRVTVWAATRYGLRKERSVHVSAKGRFVVKALPFGDYVVVAHPEYDRAPQFAPASFPVGAGRTREYLHLHSVDPIEIEIPVSVGGVLEGKIGSLSKSELQDSTVSLMGPDREILRAFARFEFDDGKHWKLTGIPPGNWTVLLTPADSGRDWAPTYFGGATDLRDAQFVEVTSGSTQRLSIDPQPAGSIAGSVIGPNDSTMGWNLVVVERWHPSTPWITVVDSDALAELGDRWQSLYRLTVNVDDRGRYLFDGLAAGRYRLRVNAASVDDESLWSPYYPDAVKSADAEEIQVAAGETTQLGPLQVLSIVGHQKPSMRLTGAPDVGATLTATVEDSHPNAVIEYVWERDGHEISGQTGSTYTVGIDDVGTIISVRADVEGRAIGGYICIESMRTRIGDGGLETDPPGLLPIQELDLAAAPSFAAVLHWVQVNAPSTSACLRRGHSSEAIDAAEMALGVSFPADLRAILGAVGGEDHGGRILPMGHLFTLDEIQDESGFQSVQNELNGLAGAVLIPFAGADGCNYCVRIHRDEIDVVYVDDVEGVEESSGWATVDQMFANILESLVSGASFHYFEPVVEEGELEWEVPGE